MQVVYNEAHRKHSPQFYFRAGSFHEHPEVVARGDRIAETLKGAGHDFVAHRDFGPQPRAAIHTPTYLGFLETAYARWQAAGLGKDGTGEMVPNLHPGRHMDGYPDGIVGQLGWHTSDLSTPLGPESFEAAKAGANSAVHAAHLVAVEGAREAYALGRPPGHHAYTDAAGGFCLLNNVAIAAQYALDHGTIAGQRIRRVAIVDVDVHHGNGTQGIFYDRADVLTVSLHCDPADFYPFFAGYAHETGNGAGQGANANFPLPKGTGDNAYLDALGGALAAIGTFSPDILFVALGVDGYEGDPFEGFKITTGGFGRIARAIAETGLPTVLVQEGGYNTDDLGANVLSFITEFEAAR